ELLLDQQDAAGFLAREVIRQARAVHAAADDDDVCRPRNVGHLAGSPSHSSLMINRPWAVGSSIAMPASQCGLNCVGMPNQLTHSSRIAAGPPPRPPTRSRRGA